MPEPKQRHTKSRRNNRRSHLALKLVSVSICPKCKSEVLPHHMCANCGFYKGREVIDVLRKLKKKERKQKENELQESQKEESKKPLTMKGLSEKS